jgi:hypothetical protein
MNQFGGFSNNLDHSQNSAFFQPQPRTNSNEQDFSHGLGGLIGGNSITDGLLRTGFDTVGREVGNVCFLSFFLILYQVGRKIDSDKIRFYFTVSNKSVLLKVRDLIFPFLKKVYYSFYYVEIFYSKRIGSGLQLWILLILVPEMVSGIEYINLLAKIRILLIYISPWCFL